MNYIPVCTQSISNWCNLVVPIVASVPNTCPAKLDSLTNVLVRDLPSYANRLIQQRRKRTETVYSSIVAVSSPEFKPIEIVSREYPVRFANAVPTQVFISTLERQYTGIRSAQVQQFHWLFISKTPIGWRLANIYSRTSVFPSVNAPITPPIESSQTIVGEAIRLWLHDCHLGKVKE